VSSESVTRCDGPGCSAEHRQGEHVLAIGWYSLAANAPDDERGRDFCSAGCLAAAAAAWAAKRVERLAEPEVRGG
jgi:hypothetical protein